jgi:hypothetical protein
MAGHVHDAGELHVTIRSRGDEARS